MIKTVPLRRSSLWKVAGLALCFLLFATHDVLAQQQQLRQITDLRKVDEDRLGDIERTCGLTKGPVYTSSFLPSAKKRSKVSADIVVEYGPGFDSNPAARDAFQRAVNTWATHIDSPVRILVDATFQSFSDQNVLGGARPAYVLGNVDGEQLVVAVNLLEAIRGDNIENFASGSGHGPGDPEVIASFNQSRTDWHFGEGPPPPGTIDFESVVLHEIGHGLQFASTFSYNTGDGNYACNGSDGAACWGFGTGEPSTYDQQVVQFNSQNDTFVDMLSFPNDSQALGDALTVTASESSTEQVRFNGDLATGNASVTGGPQPPILYAPGSWEPGSSLGHLDENTYAAGTANALMTPRIGSGESARDPGPVVCGSLNDMGWPLGTDCLAYVAAPLNFAVSGQDSTQGSVELSWFISPTADIASYTVQRKRFGGTFQTIATLPGDTEPLFLDTDVGLGFYTYRLQYEKQNGESGTVEEMPTARIGFTSLEGNLQRGDLLSSVTINWTVPPSTSGYGYMIERTSGAVAVDSTFQTVGRVESGMEFTDTGLYPATYKYRVRAVDGDGNSITSPNESIEIDFDGDAFVTGPNPNPVTAGMDNVQLVISTDQTQDITVAVYNTLGQQVYEDDLSLRRSSTRNVQIPVERLGSGVYFVRITGRTFARTQKMAVTR